MARPKKQYAIPMCQVCALITEADYNQLKIESEKMGMSMAKLIKDAIVEKLANIRREK